MSEYPNEKNDVDHPHIFSHEEKIELLIEKFTEMEKDLLMKDEIIKTLDCQRLEAQKYRERETSYAYSLEVDNRQQMTKLKELTKEVKEKDKEIRKWKDLVLSNEKMYEKMQLQCQEMVETRSIGIMTEMKKEKIENVKEKLRRSPKTKKFDKEIDCRLNCTNCETLSKELINLYEKHRPLPKSTTIEEIYEDERDHDIINETEQFNEIDPVEERPSLFTEIFDLYNLLLTRYRELEEKYQNNRHFQSMFDVRNETNNNLRRSKSSVKFPDSLTTIQEYDNARRTTTDDEEEMNCTINNHRLYDKNNDDNVVDDDDDDKLNNEMLREQRESRSLTPPYRSILQKLQDILRD
ncbi:hypothetical protein SNEBB_001592 [Seison nebaliae]|nr:hypothetical protein SNEBB_001592 [Seison nebaliae]